MKDFKELYKEIKGTVYGELAFNVFIYILPFYILNILPLDVSGNLISDIVLKSVSILLLAFALGTVSIIAYRNRYFKDDISFKSVRYMYKWNKLGLIVSYFLSLLIVLLFNIMYYIGMQYLLFIMLNDGSSTVLILFWLIVVVLIYIILFRVITTFKYINYRIIKDNDSLSLNKVMSISNDLNRNLKGNLRKMTLNTIIATILIIFIPVLILLIGLSHLYYDIPIFLLVDIIFAILIIMGAPFFILINVKYYNKKS